MVTTHLHDLARPSVIPGPTRQDHLVPTRDHLSRTKSLVPGPRNPAATRARRGGRRPCRQGLHRPRLCPRPRPLPRPGTPASQRIPTARTPARRPCNLRHAALSLWLTAGVAPEEAPARAGNSPTILHTVYTHPVPGQERPPTPSSTAPCTHLKAPQTITARQPPARTARDWPTKPLPGPPGPVRHASVSQRDPAGRSGTQLDPDSIPPPTIWPLTCADTMSAIPGTAGDPYRPARSGPPGTGR
jgi:hypothetical protein